MLSLVIHAGYESGEICRKKTQRGFNMNFFLCNDRYFLIRMNHQRGFIVYTCINLFHNKNNNIDCKKFEK